MIIAKVVNPGQLDSEARAKAGTHTGTNHTLTILGGTGLDSKGDLRCTNSDGTLLADACADLKSAYSVHVAIPLPNKAALMSAIQADTTVPASIKAWLAIQ